MNHRFYRALAFVILALSLSVKPDGLSLKSAIAATLGDYPGLKATEMGIKISKEAQRKILAGYLPQISTSLNIDQSPHLSQTEKFISFHTNQLLWSFDGPLLKNKQARLHTARAKFTDKAARDCARFETTDAFLSAWLSQKKYILTTSLENRIREIITHEKLQSDAGITNETQWQVAYAEQIGTQTEIENYADVLTATLAPLEELTGIQLTMPDKQGKNKMFVGLSFSPGTIKLFTLDKYKKLAQENRKDLKAKEKEIAAFNTSSTITRSDYLPSVSVTSRLDYSLNNNPLPDTTSKLPLQQFYCGLKASMPIFDGFARHFDANIEKSKAVRSTLERDQLLKKIEKDLVVTHCGLRNLIRDLENKKVYLSAAKQTMSLTLDNYQAGLILKKDLIIAAHKYNTEQFAWLELVIKAQREHHRLLAQCGYPELA